MKSIDAALLRSATRASHAVQQLTGVACYGQAAHMLVGFIVCDGVSSWLSNIVPVALSLSALMLVGWSFQLRSAYAAEREWRASPDAKPPSALMFVAWERWWVRAMLLLVFALQAWGDHAVLHKSLYAVFSEASAVSLLAFVYLVCVTPQAPSAQSQTAPPLAASQGEA